MQFFLYLIFFLFVVFLVFTITAIFTSSRTIVMQRLIHQTTSASHHSQDEERSGSWREDLLLFLGALGKVFSRRSYIDQMQRKLIQAHIKMRAEELIGVAVLSALGAFALVFLMTKVLFVGVFAAILSGMLPSFIVTNKKNKRMHALNEQLPEALSMIANALRAGYSFPQAMFVASQEMEAPIAEEFGRVVRENRLGKPMEDVLIDLSARTDNEDLDMVVTALLIQKQVGGNLAEILNKIEHTIRERIRIRVEIRTLTAQQRLSAVIIALLPVIVTFLLMLLNPEYILMLFTQTAGLMLLSTAIFLQIIGMILIRRIVKIEI